MKRAFLLALMMLSLAIVGCGAGEDGANAENAGETVDAGQAKAGDM